MVFSFLQLEVQWWALIIAIISLTITIFKDYIKPWLFSPKLELYGKNDNYHIEEAENLTKHRYMRLKIKNSDCFFTPTAKNCYVKLNEIRKDNKLMYPFTPTILKWSLYDEEKEPITKRKHNLAKGEYHFIDLCSESEKGKKILFFQTPLTPKLAEKLEPGKYTFKIGIYGDNFKPKFETFNVEYTENFGELKFIKENEAKIKIQAD